MHEQRESLRYTPPVTWTERVAVMDEILPLGHPIAGYGGKCVSEVHVDKGTVIVIDIARVNRSKAIFGDDADSFRPERWLERDGQLTKDAKSFMTWPPLLTFLGGPR